MGGTLKKSVIYTYGMGILAFDLLNAMNSSYWAYFMTDVAFISAATMGTILLLSRIIDWISVPIVGVVMEKVNFKWGKYRSWLIIAPPFLFVFFITMFTNPNFNTILKAFYLGGAYVLASIFINVSIATRNTLVPILGKTQEDRVLLAAKKAQGGTAGKIIFGLISLPLILAINDGQKSYALGYQVTTAIFAFFLVFTFLALFFAIPNDNDDENERIKGSEDKLTVGEMITLFFKNGPFLAIVFADGTRYVAQFTLMGLAMYYFKYVYNNMVLFAVLFTTINIVAFVGTVLVEFIAKKIDKRTTYLLGLGILLTAHIANWFLAKDALTFIVIISIGYFGAALMNGTSLALCSDGVIYGEWRSGKDAKGFLMSMTNMCPKIGMVIAGALIGYGLAVIGYQPNVAITSQIAYGLNLLINIVPAIFLLLGGLAMFLFNPLNKRKMEEIQQGINNRKITI